MALSATRTVPDAPDGWLAHGRVLSHSLLGGYVADVRRGCPPDGAVTAFRTAAALCAAGSAEAREAEAAAEEAALLLEAAEARTRRGTPGTCVPLADATGVARAPLTLFDEDAACSGSVTPAHAAGVALARWLALAPRSGAPCFGQIECNSMPCRVLSLGARSTAAGLAAGVRGCRHVTLAERASALPLLRCNVAANARVDHTGLRRPACVARWHWRDDAAAPIPRPPDDVHNECAAEVWEWVLAADCVLHESDVAPFVAAAARLTNGTGVFESANAPCRAFGFGLALKTAAAAKPWAMPGALLLAQSTPDALTDALVAALARDARLHVTEVPLERVPQAQSMAATGGGDGDDGAGGGAVGGAPPPPRVRIFIATVGPRPRAVRLGAQRPGGQRRQRLLGHRRRG
jgi:hypothetical protein